MAEELWEVKSSAIGYKNMYQRASERKGCMSSEELRSLSLYIRRATGKGNKSELIMGDMKECKKGNSNTGSSIIFASGRAGITIYLYERTGLSPALTVDIRGQRRFGMPCHKTTFSRD